MGDIATDRQLSNIATILDPQDIPELPKELGAGFAERIAQLWRVSTADQQPVLLKLARQAADLEAQLAKMESQWALQIAAVRHQQQRAKDQEAIAFLAALRANSVRCDPDENAALEAEWEDIMQAVDRHHSPDSATSP
ncbi:MAG: hypothetical protein M3Z04_03505 [Chloroflexota bacterium]|nr:hypothetical protein [Chloroflexota bacterium]